MEIESGYRKEKATALNTIIAVATHIRDNKSESLDKDIEAIKVIQRCLPELIRSLIYFNNLEKKI